MHIAITCVPSRMLVELKRLSDEFCSSSLLAPACTSTDSEISDRQNFKFNQDQWQKEDHKLDKGRLARSEP